MADNVLNNLTYEQSELNVRIFNLVLGRVFKSAYLGLDKKQQREMEQVFLSEDDKAKEEFIKKHIPDFESVFKKELKNIEKDLLDKLEKQTK